jgi:hypothetical protein
MDSSRNSSFSSLVSAITLDEDFGHNSNVAASVASNSCTSTGSVTAALGNRLGSYHCSAADLYSDGASASFMTATTTRSPSPRAKSQQFLDSRSQHDGTYCPPRSVLSSSLPCSLPTRVSRFDMVCSNPPSSSAELKVPIHPNSQHSRSKRDDEEVEEHIAGGDAYIKTQDRGHCDRHSSQRGTFNFNSMLPLSKPVHQRTLADGDDGATVDHQEPTMTISTSLPASLYGNREGIDYFKHCVTMRSPSLPSPSLPVNSTMPVPQQRGLAARDGKIMMNATKIIPNRFGPRYPRRTLSMCTRRFSLDTACSRHTTLVNSIVDGTNKRNARERSEVDDAGLAGAFQGSHHPASKRFRRHSTPWLSSTRNVHPAAENIQPNAAFNTTPCCPKQDDGAYDHMLIISEKIRSGKMLALNFSDLTPHPTQSTAPFPTSHKVVRGIDAHHHMMIQPKRQDSATFDLMSDDGEPHMTHEVNNFHGGDPSFAVSPEAGVSSQVPLRRMRDMRDTLVKLPLLVRRNTLPPSKPVRQRSFGHSNSLLSDP